MRISEAIGIYGYTEPEQDRGGSTSAKVVAQSLFFVAVGLFIVAGAIAAEAPKPTTTATKAANAALRDRRGEVKQLSKQAKGC